MDLDETFTIEKFSKRGLGLTGSSAKKLEVFGAIPGEKVQLKKTHRKKGKIQAEIVRLVNASQDRKESECRHFGECGGCSWQHMHYKRQLTEKNAHIRKLFSGMVESYELLQAVTPCASLWQYRNKVELTFSEHPEWGKKLGFIRRRSRGTSFELEECLLMRDWMLQAKNAVIKWWQKQEISAFRIQNGTGTLRNLILREGKNTQEKMMILVVNGKAEDALPKNVLENFKKEMQKALPELSSLFLFIHQAIPNQPTQIFEMLLSGKETLLETMQITFANQQKTLKFHLSPSAFFQPNTSQAEVLYSKVLKALEPTREDIVYDLYCGVGTLGLCAAPYTKQVYGVELNRYAVYDAQANAEINKSENVEFIAGDVVDIVPALPKASKVIVDPPRAGLGMKMAQWLGSLDVERIVYVSCNPDTQKEDLLTLLPMGWKISEIHPVDQFPQTPHIENIVLLKRENR